MGAILAVEPGYLEVHPLRADALDQGAHFFGEPRLAPVVDFVVQV